MTRPTLGTLCIGAAHWDIIGRAGGSLHPGDDVPGRIERRPGGVALNVARALAARDCATSLCAVVGGDDAGDALVRATGSAGVDCGHILRIADAPTDCYMAIESGTGDLIAAIADAGLLEAHAEALINQVGAALPKAERLFLDANLPTAAIGAIGAQAARADLELIVNPVSPAKAPHLGPLLSESLRLGVIANLSEARALTGQAHDDAPAAATALIGHGARLALVTNGPDPVALAMPEGAFLAKPGLLPTGMSVTGAGDALLAAFLSVPDLEADPQAALDFAVKAATEHMIKSTQ